MIVTAAQCANGVYDDEQDREGCIPADELRFVLKHIPTGVSADFVVHPLTPLEHHTS
jgi:hypothetical protein